MRILFSVLCCVFAFAGQAQENDNSSQQEIIYGHKDGLAMTMIMLQPASGSNGKAIVDVVSGNWISSYNYAEFGTKQSSAYLSKGYTVFLVMHGSQPRFTIDEALSDLKRAVRFVRYHASEYKIDPDHIGITGASSGGHLSLLVGLTDTKTDSLSTDPVDKVSSRVQAVAVFFPPTDFLNYGAAGFNPTKQQEMMKNFGVAAAFDFKKWDKQKQEFIPYTMEEKQALAKELSPIYAVTKDDPPVFIVHGDADMVVPLQQSTSLTDKLKATGVKTELVVKKGAGHGWENPGPEKQQFVSWFDKYLK